MAHVQVKPGKLKVDPKRPSSHPDWESAVAAGDRNKDAYLGSMENDAERRDYLKKVASNPNNVVGLPATYPPLQIKVYHTGLVFPDVPLGRLALMRARDMQIQEGNILCSSCGTITPHSLFDTGSFCKICGNQKPFTNHVD